MKIDTPDDLIKHGRVLTLNAPQHEKAKSSIALGGNCHRFFRLSDLQGKPIPERESLVPGFIPSNTVTIFSGDGGTGKSLLAQQLSIAAATNGKWLGQPVKHGPALFLTAEDDEAEVHRRAADILRAEGREFRDAVNIVACSLAGMDALFASVNRDGGALIPSPLFKEVEEQVALLRPVVVINDTLADFYPGNENDRTMARQFVSMLRGVSIRQRTAMVLLAHPSLTGISAGTGTSGSTGWNNSARSRLYLERIIDGGYEPDPDARRLTVKKSNYGRVGSEITMKWRDGVFVADPVETGFDRTMVNYKAERVFLKLVDLMAEQGRNISPSPSANYAPKLFAGHPEREGVSKDAFKLAMERLLANGAIKVRITGPDSRKETTIIRQPTQGGHPHDGQ